VIFNDEHKVIIGTMNKAEASAFVKFLKSEILRHHDDIKQARELIKLIESEEFPE